MSEVIIEEKPALTKKEKSSPGLINRPSILPVSSGRSLQAY